MGNGTDPQRHAGFTNNILLFLLQTHWQLVATRIQKGLN